MATYNIERPFSTPFTVEINSLKVGRLLALYFGKCFLPADRIHPETIVIDEIDNTHFIIRYNQQKIITDSLLKELNNIFFEHTLFDKSILALHGAAVEYENNAYVFLAPTGEGKTTLTSYLLHRNCRYITDDCVFIDRTSMHVFPSLMPLHLRPGGLSVLRYERAVPDGIMLMDDGATRRFVFFPKEITDNSVPIKCIFIVKRNDVHNMIVKTPISDRIDFILKSMFDPKLLDIQCFRLIASLANMRCYILQYCNLEYVYHTLRNE